MKKPEANSMHSLLEKNRLKKVIVLMVDVDSVCPQSTTNDFLFLLAPGTRT
jgi:hypothetical protein